MIADKFKRHYYSFLRMCDLIWSIIRGRTWVYNKEIQENHEYFADGILVHNCPLCGDLDGVVLTIDEATGLIPRHPRCRCSWAPTSKAIKEQDQKRGGAALKAIRESIKSEGPKTIKRTFKETKDRSAWAGKELL